MTDPHWRDLKVLLDSSLKEYITELRTDIVKEISSSIDDNICLAFERVETSLNEKIQALQERLQKIEDSIVSDWRLYDIAERYCTVDNYDP